MKPDNNKIEFSFYELSLLTFLKESHPEKADDTAFIKARAAMAAEAYSNAFDNGYAIPLCAEMANEVLFQGLHFSKHDTIINILWNEFADIVPQASAGEVAFRLLPLCAEVFAKYPLSDDFAYSPEYELLYTELTGTLQIKVEEDGCL